MNNSCLIVNPYDSNTKYKYSLKRIFFHKKLKNCLKFPFNTGVFKRTLLDNGKTIENFVLVKDKLFPYIYVNVKIIGGFKYINNEGKYCYITLSYPNISDYEDIHDIIDVPHLSLEEIKLFILQYSNYEKEKIKWIGFFDKNEADEIFNSACIKYKVNKDKIEQNTNSVIY